MSDSFSRTQLLLGDKAMEKIRNARVAVFGIGGVGGYVVEALIRSGLEEIDIIDNDSVSITNINRQIIATVRNIGRDKVDVAEERIKEINPRVLVHKHRTFFTPETSAEFQFSQYDYVVDAIDTVAGKIELILKCNETATPIISSMGAGNKLDPTAFEVADIYQTSVCPLARVMRHELKKRGIQKLKVVYSKEKPITPLESTETKGTTGRAVPGSIAFVPSVVGLIVAGEVIKDIIK